MKKALRNFFVAAAGLAFIVACGGGSDDGGGLTGGVPPSEPATITMDNAPQIAGAVAEVAMGQGIFSSIFVPDLPIAAIGGDVAVSPVMKPVLSAALKSASPSQLYVTSSGQEACAVSGTVDITVNISNPAQPSVNDSFDFLFTACDDGTGAVLNGGMTVTISSLNGDFESGNMLLGMSMQFSAFAVTENDETVTATGTVSIQIDTRTPPVTIVSVSITSLVTSSQGTEEVLTSFNITITEDASTFPTAVTVETSFTISSPSIGGSVSVTTSLALQSMGAEYPFVGELRITGAGNAVIVMIAVDANTVRLQIDADGDSAFEEQLEMTWDDLMAAAG